MTGLSRVALASVERAPLREPCGGARLPPEGLELLSDPGAGVFADWHFWPEKTRRRYGYAWGRGQGWALLGLLDLLDYLPEEHRAFSDVRHAFAGLAAARNIRL